MRQEKTSAATWKVVLLSGHYLNLSIQGGAVTLKCIDNWHWFPLQVSVSFSILSLSLFLSLLQTETGAVLHLQSEMASADTQVPGWLLKRHAKTSQPVDLTPTMAADLEWKEWRSLVNTSIGLRKVGTGYQMPFSWSTLWVMEHSSWHDPFTVDY